MAKFVETITNIFKIEELKKRIIYTLLLVLVYRLGCYIILPGLDPEVLKGGISGTQEGLVGLLNMFSGGRGPASRHVRPFLPQDADGRRERPPEDEPDHPLPDHRDPRDPGPGVRHRYDPA